jgi:hypothetical protein
MTTSLAEFHVPHDADAIRLIKASVPVKRRNDLSALDGHIVKLNLYELEGTFSDAVKKMKDMRANNSHVHLLDSLVWPIFIIFESFTNINIG